jgi:diguanylate cyclase (GGDEF)-like protein
MRLPQPELCIIDADPTERAVLSNRFIGQGFRVLEADSAATGLATLREQRPAVVICDVAMPDASGIDVCEQVRADASLAGIFFIMLTADASPARKHAALQAGADDYLVKPCDEVELEAKVRNGLRLAGLQADLRHAAMTDGLTGLWNHNHFREQLGREYGRARRYGDDVAVLIVDLDHFKAVNDTYGHETGNAVLAQTATLLTQTVRDSDIVARYGGEEFVVVCPQTRLPDAAQLAERIRAVLPLRLRVADHPELRVRASVGVAAASDASVHSPCDLVNLADRALYLAKTQGRNAVRTALDVDRDDAVVDLVHGEVDRLRKEVVTLNMQAKELYLQSVWSLVQALEARDPFTAAHSRNVAYFAERVALAANWARPVRDALVNAARLHDLGMIGIPDRILQKPGALSETERATLRRVPLLTCKIIEPLRVFATEVVMIRHLREAFDGTGYPDGLSGTAIPVGSRLLRIAEAFEALTADRVHRPAWSFEDALDLLAADAGGTFDPDLVEQFVAVARREQIAWERQITARALPTIARD